MRPHSERKSNIVRAPQDLVELNEGLMLGTIRPHVAADLVEGLKDSWGDLAEQFEGEDVVVNPVFVINAEKRRQVQPDIGFALGHLGIVQIVRSAELSLPGRPKRFTRHDVVGAELLPSQPGTPNRFVLMSSPIEKYSRTSEFEAAFERVTDKMPRYPTPPLPTRRQRQSGRLND